MKRCNKEMNNRFSLFAFRFSLNLHTACLMSPLNERTQLVKISLSASLTLKKDRMKSISPLNQLLIFFLSERETGRHEKWPNGFLLRSVEYDFDNIEQ
jgi:hypothetical protein